MVSMTTTTHSRAPRFAGRIVWTPQTGWTDDGPTVCRYCGSFEHIVGEFDRPDHHTSARCVEVVEPVR